MRRILVLVLVLISLSTLVGCTSNTIPAGEGGVRVRAGDWIAEGDAGAFMLEFRVATDGSKIFAYSYAFPCDGKTHYVLPPKPIKAELRNSQFEMTVDDIDLSPKLIFTGEFVDATHAEGTWETSAFGNYFLDMACSAAKGTWQGSPQ
jgi:hypothetical protein